MLVADWAGYLAFRDGFAAAIDPRLYTMDWLDRRVLDGTAQFWRARDAGLLTELRHYPSGAKDVHALVAAGNLASIIADITPAVEAWAMSIGCLGAIVESREGWTRMLKPLGYHLYQIAVRKEF